MREKRDDRERDRGREIEGERDRGRERKEWNGKNICPQLFVRLITQGHRENAVN